MDAGWAGCGRLSRTAGLIPTLARGLLLAAMLSVAGCGGKAVRWSPDYHVVRSGETLYAIAWRYGLDHRELAAWNGLGDGSLIYPGQRIRLRPSVPSGAQARSPAAQSAGTPSASPVPRAPPVRPVKGWAWPTADGLNVFCCAMRAAARFVSAHKSVAPWGACSVPADSTAWIAI